MRGSPRRHFSCLDLLMYIFVFHAHTSFFSFSLCSRCSASTCCMFRWEDPGHLSSKVIGLRTAPTVHTIFRLVHLTSSCLRRPSKVVAHRRCATAFSQVTAPSAFGIVRLVSDTLLYSKLPQLTLCELFNSPFSKSTR